MLSRTGRPEAKGRRQCGKVYFDLDNKRSELRYVELLYMPEAKG